MANLITGVRILCGLALLFFPAFPKWFYVFYAAGGLSDVLDGWTARRLGEVSDFILKKIEEIHICFFPVKAGYAIFNVHSGFGTVLRYNE